jgi:hypothetical protein
LRGEIYGFTHIESTILYPAFDQALFAHTLGK